MYFLLSLVFIVFLLSVLVSMVAFLISKKTLVDREKGTPYECGFDPKGSARLPFSLRFFLIAVIFLIFDVEVALLLPFVCVMKVVDIFSWMFTGIFFLVILLLGLYYEWWYGALDWSE